MSSSRRVIGTRSKSRDEQDSKENVENDGPTTAPKTPGTAKTSRSAASLFSPPLRGSPSPYSMHSETMKKQPDPFPDNWEEAMGAPSSASRRSKAREPPDSSFGYSGGGGGMSQQTDSKGDDRKVMSWESRDRGVSNVHRQDCGGNNYGSLAADLDLVAREGVADDFPAVADCFNLGSFSEESPPRRNRTSPKGSPQSYEQGQPYPYRSSPPPPYPPSGLPHGSPHHYPPYPPGGAGPPPMYYQGPPASSPYGYPPPPQVPPHQGGPYRYAHQPYQGEPWMSPPAQFPDFAPPGRGTPPRGSPPPKKRRSSDWDNGRSSSSSPGEEGSTTPEKAFPEKQEPMRSPFRSPVPTGERSSTKKSKRSPLFQGGTPGIAAYGSWDTPGGTLNAALGDEFSPMGPFAPFADESLEGAPEAPMTFDTKLSLAASSSGEDPAPSHPPAIRQRPTGQPAASPFSAFVGDLSPFPPPPPPPPPMRGSPVNLEQRDYAARHHPGHQAYHRSPPDVFPRHPGMPTPSKRNGLGGPAGRHPMASPVMSGSAQRQQPWYEHVAPSPGPFRLELGDGKSRKGFEDINSLLRGATGPPPHQRPTPSPPQDSYGSAGRPGSASSQVLSTPMKSDGGPPGSSGRGSSYHGSARKTPRGSATPSYTPLSKSMGTAATPGSKTPSSGRRGGPTSMSKKSRRNPCNCKKSKCLKLYCECFAGELYCDGCNCNDCHNTTAYEPERQKAMKDTRAKNPNAFKARVTVKAGPSVGTTTPAGGHNMGCRCKKSECLKKYCECFQAGVMCAGKCKCVDCLNFVGSQALIDKRRKMKDHRGAEMAMRIAEEAWKGGKHSGPRNVRGRGLKPSPVGRGRPPLPMPHMMQPSPSPHHRGPPPPPPPGYMGPMMGHPLPHMGYSHSPMGMPPVTPGYAHGKQQMIPVGGRGMISAKGEPKAGLKKHHSGPTPKTVTPRAPAVRLGFDPHSSKKKRKLGPGEKEPTFSFFGDRPEQPKTTALAIFSYLSNDDLFNSTLVCKQWNKLALDDELWQF